MKSSTADIENSRGTLRQWTDTDTVQAARCGEYPVESFEEAVMYCLNRAEGDGLPLMPPTQEAISRMLAFSNRKPTDIVGSLDSRRVLTVLQVATCGVMAGAPPETFPIILATWDALFEPQFNLNAVLSSSGGAALTCVVSGGFASTVGMNAGAGLFGPGNRANATVGRAVRLGARMALGARHPMDASSLGNPSKFTAHLAEGSPPPGWPTYRESVGYGESDTTVTVMGTDAPRQVYQASSRRGGRLLQGLSACMRDPSHIAAGTALGRGEGMNFMVVLGPEHAQVLSDGGFSRADVASELADRSRLTSADLQRAGVDLIEERHVPDIDGLYPSTFSERIVVVTAGAPGAGWSAVIPGWAYALESRAATRTIDEVEL
jgi:hypothetical protein